MKKIFIIAFIGLLTISVYGCDNSKDDNDSSISYSTVQETNLDTTTEEENYKINIPYSAFGSEGVSDEDCIVTGTDMRNGILSKELSGNGGIIITVDKDKYGDLLEVAKTEFENEVDSVTDSEEYIEKIEYSDNLDTISIYLSQSYFETKPMDEQTDDGRPMAQIPDTPKIIYYGNIFKDSIYYQSLVKKADTELITCQYTIINSGDNSAVDDCVYPEK